jgi:hypothetical protein
VIAPDPATGATPRRGRAYGTTIGRGSIRMIHSPFWLSFTYASPFL